MTKKSKPNNLKNKNFQNFLFIHVEKLYVLMKHKNSEIKRCI